MSIVVTPEELAETLTRFGYAFLVTIAQDGRARVVSVNVALVDGTLVVTDTGRGARNNVAARPDVTLVWPPADPRELSLILDGKATLLDDALAVPVGQAILHRPAPAPAAT